MSTVQESPNPLGVEPVQKLLLRYSIPTAFTLMVNYLYNIVDQIFVGQGVGISGMAATNVAFPLSILVTALALLLGDGCAANISLCLGRGQQQTADTIASHTISLLVCSGLLMTGLCGIFAPQIVLLFGSTDSVYADSLAYMRTIAWGVPFQLLGPSLTAIIRADGSPQYAMKCSICGAVLNLILDPIFIFPLKMGVVGAGIATVISQVVAGLLCFAYLPHMKSVRIHKAALRPTWALSRRILLLGIPSMINQLMTALVQIVMNNLMRYYGVMSIYGSDMALSVYGMIMKIYQIAHSMFVGVSSATQPINGYNFGAGNYQRVQQTYSLTAKISIIISIFWFATYQLFPRQIGMLFVPDNALYFDCSAHFFHLYMLGFFLYGLHMTTAAFFQGIGSPGKSLWIPLMRQGVFLIPLALLLSACFGLDGALMAAPLADALSFILSLVLVKKEFHKWRMRNWLPTV